MLPFRPCTLVSSKSVLVAILLLSSGNVKLNSGPPTNIKASKTKPSKSFLNFDILNIGSVVNKASQIHNIMNDFNLDIMKRGSARMLHRLLRRYRTAGLLMSTCSSWDGITWWWLDTFLSSVSCCKTDIFKLSSLQVQLTKINSMLPPTTIVNVYRRHHHKQSSSMNSFRSLAPIRTPDFYCAATWTVLERMQTTSTTTFRVC